MNSELVVEPDRFEQLAGEQRAGADHDIDLLRTCAAFPRVDDSRRVGAQGRAHHADSGPGISVRLQEDSAAFPP